MNIDRDIQAVNVLDAWKYSNFMCKNDMMNDMADVLYNVYCLIKTAKELWEDA